MSEIKTDKITPSLNPTKVTIHSGVSVKDETKLLDRQESFSVTEKGEIKLLGPLNVGNLAETSSGNTNQVLLSRGPTLPPKWGAVPSVICPQIPGYGSFWNIGDNTFYQLGRGSGTDHTVYSTTSQGGGESSTKLQSITDYLEWSYVSKSAPAGIRKDGTLWTWGNYTLGQLGTGKQTSYNSSNFPLIVYCFDLPVQVGTDTNWIKVCGNPLTTGMWGLKNDGSVWVWGSNDNYTYAAGNLYSSNFKCISAEPIRLGIDLPSDFIFLDNDGYRLIKQNGTLWAWGRNYNYDTGIANNGNNSTGIDVKVVTQVGTDTDWKYVSLTKGIKIDGSLWSWGTAVAVGDGRTTGSQSQKTPKQISSDRWKTVQVNSNRNRVFAIKEDGTLWAWGANSSGYYLGLGSMSINTNILTPTQVGIDNDWKDVAWQTTDAAFLLKENGTLWAVGYFSQNYTLGNSSSTDTIYYTPTQVPVGRNILWGQIGSGGYNNVFQGIGNEVLVAPQYTLAQWLRTGYTSLSNNCGNQVLNRNDTQPDAPSGWAYCDGRNGTVNMKTFVNPITQKLDWPPIDNVDGCGKTPSNINGLISGQITYIQKLS